MKKLLLTEEPKVNVKMQKIKWGDLILSLIIVYAVAFIGSIFTSSNVSSEWYNNVKPSITPPNWVFPIVWNILFFLIAISLYLAWTNTKTQKDKLIFAFGINFILNILWSVFFFSLKNPLLAFFDLILLLISILYLIILTCKINKISAYLLIPYLVWLIFAGILNVLILIGSFI